MPKRVITIVDENLQVQRISLDFDGNSCLNTTKIFEAVDKSMKAASDVELYAPEKPKVKNDTLEVKPKTNEGEQLQEGA